MIRLSLIEPVCPLAPYWIAEDDEYEPGTRVGYGDTPDRAVEELELQ